MYNSALLLIGEAISQARLLRLFEFARGHAKQRVYVSLNPALTRTLADCLFCINTCYKSAETLACSEAIDVRVLLPDESAKGSVGGRRQADLLIVDSVLGDDESVRRKASELLYSVPPVLLHADVDAAAAAPAPSPTPAPALADDCPSQPYEYLALGGTFDRLHNGHKILLSVGALFCSRQLTVGMTTEPMLNRKTLGELIEPLGVRAQSVRDFLHDIKPGLHYHVCPLDDPWGPPAHDPRYLALVASPETQAGCERINALRADKQLAPCRIHVVEVVDDARRDPAHEEDKVSSSTRRRRMLGTLLRPPRRPYAAGLEPYVVGLTGGIASGKSTIRKRLAARGAHTIDCDLLGHATYRRGTHCNARILDAFGLDVLDQATGDIDRRRLGSFVFGHKENMRRLTSIVWPEILHLAKDHIAELWAAHQHEAGPCIIVLEAAVLLDAGWDSICHEVWASFVPKDEAITRILNRNGGLSKEDAANRVESQRSNRDYIEAANVILCTLWDYEYTDAQLTKAWTLLLQRMGAEPPTGGSRL